MILAAHFLFSLGAGLLAQAPARPESDDGFNLFLFLLLVGFLVVCLILVGVGVVLALATIAGTAVLAALGIVSTSAAVALWRRRLAAGVRAFHYQVCAALGLPAGVLGWWAVSALFNRVLPPRWIILPGLVMGAMVGLSLAAVGDWTLRRLGRGGPFRGGWPGRGPRRG